MARRDSSDLDTPTGLRRSSRSRAWRPCLPQTCPVS